MSRFVILLVAYTLLGALAFTAINARRKDGEGKSRWVKLAVYIGITVLLTGALLKSPLLSLILGVLISLGGLVEMVRLPGLTGFTRGIILAGYLLIAAAFCTFLFTCPVPGLMANVYVIVLSFDGFSQVAGQLIGGPRIAPRISPGKTWSGLAGGCVMGIATGAFLAASLRADVLLGGLCICLLAFTGDMLASCVKRLAGVKDYSSLIPGHGGILDRFDSLLFTAAVLLLYFRLT